MYFLLIVYNFTTHLNESTMLQHSVPLDLLTTLRFLMCYSCCDFHSQGASENMREGERGHNSYQQERCGELCPALLYYCHFIDHMNHQLPFHARDNSQWDGHHWDDHQTGWCRTWVNALEWIKDSLSGGQWTYHIIQYHYLVKKWILHKRWDFERLPTRQWSWL